MRFAQARPSNRPLLKVSLPISLESELLHCGPHRSIVGGNEDAADMVAALARDTARNFTTFRRT